MADINTQELYDVKLVKFGVGDNSERFESVFLAGLKYVLARVRAKLEDASVTTPVGLDTPITLDADVWYAAISSAMDSFINGHGSWTLDTKVDLLAIAREDLNFAVMQHYRVTTEITGKLGAL